MPAPRKIDSKRRVAPIICHATKKERAAVTALATKRELTVSDLIRGLLHRELERVG